MSEPMSREEREAVERSVDSVQSYGVSWMREEDAFRLADAARRYLALTAAGGDNNFEGSDGGPLPAEPMPPVVPCIACAHILPLACWDERFRETGICAECLRLAAPNRGGCSHTRGCDCTQDGVSWRIRDAESANQGNTSDKPAEGPGGEW